MTALSEVAQIFCQGADILNCSSSENEWCMIECETMIIIIVIIKCYFSGEHIALS